MICAIFERRPRTQRSIRDSRAAKLLGTFKIVAAGRDFEISKKIREEVISQGYRPAAPPYRTKHKEWDWVVYVHPQDATSPMKNAPQKNKPVSVGASSSMISRRLPLPTRRRAVKNKETAVMVPKKVSKKTSSRSKAETIPSRKRPTPSASKRLSDE